MDTTYSLQARLWQEVLFFTIALAGVASILLWPLPGIEGLGFIMSVLAVVSGLLLAMSFSLSSFSYYFNFLDDKVVYRKQLGLMGYFVAVGYGISAIIEKPDVYLYSFPENLLTAEVGLGVLAMAIFTLMALVSNAKAIQILGGKLWKDILGLGYIAYALLIIRGIFLDGLLWQNLFAEESGSVTPRMMLIILGIVVLLLRVSVPIHKKFFNNTQYV